jgi:NTE family protein
MTVAFVLSGGASLGAVQVGMARALEEHDIRPDLIVGTSVGPINGAWLASGRDIDGLDRVRRKLKRNQLFPLRPWTGLRGFAGFGSHFVPNSGVRRLVRRHLNFSRLEDAPIPLIVIATDVLTGMEVPLRSGDAVEAILASAALPGVFPPIEIDGQTLFDGGVVDNTPITQAIEAGATEVWVLSTGYSCGLESPPSNAAGMAMHAVALLVQQRLATETKDREFAVPVHLIPPPCPLDVTPADFSQTDMLIDRAAAGTRQWLSNGCPHALPLVFPHEHSPA